MGKSIKNIFIFLKCRLEEAWVTFDEIFMKFQIKKAKYNRLLLLKIFGGISFDLRGLKAQNVTLKRTDLLLDLMDFLEFKEWQRMRDRRDGGICSRQKNRRNADGIKMRYIDESNATSSC